MRKIRGREEMLGLLELRAEEKLTLRELSEQSGVPISTLSYWSGKVRREGAARARETKPSIVPVDLIDGSAPEGITVEVGDGLQVLVEPGFDATHLSRLVAVLRSQC